MCVCVNIKHTLSFLFRKHIDAYSAIEIPRSIFYCIIRNGRYDNISYCCHFSWETGIIIFIDIWIITRQENKSFLAVVGNN